MLFAEGQFSDRLGGLLGRLKAMIKKNANKVNACDYFKTARWINYYRFSKSITDIDSDIGSVYEVDGVYEADITAAYYAAALGLGFINKNMYRECLKLKKEERLKLMGAIATVSVTRWYNCPLADLPPEVKKDPLLREAWFKICSYVDAALQFLQDYLGESFLFYWVDGIYYVDKAGAYSGKSFKDYMTNAGFLFDWKVTKLKTFELRNKGFIEIFLEKYKDGRLEQKRFYPKRTAIRSYKIIDRKNFYGDIAL